MAAFIDNIKLTAPDDITHLNLLEEVLKRLQKYNIAVSLKKASF